MADEFDQYKKKATTDEFDQYKAAPATPPAPPGIKPPHVNMQEAEMPSVGRGFNQFMGNMSVNNPLSLVDKLGDIAGSTLSHIPGNPLRMRDAGTRYSDEDSNPLAIPKQIGSEIANQDYDKAAGDIAPLLLPHAGNKVVEVANSPVGKGVVGAVKGSAQAFKPITYGMHKLPVPEFIANSMAGHFTASPFGPVAAKAGAVVGGAMPFLKHAYEGGKEAYQTAQQDSRIAAQRAQPFEYQTEASSPYTAPPVQPLTPAAATNRSLVPSGPPPAPVPPRVSLADQAGAQANPHTPMPTIEPIRPAAASSRALAPAGPPATPAALRTPLHVQAGITTPTPTSIPAVEPVTGLSAKTYGPKDILPDMGPKPRPLEEPTSEATDPNNKNPTPPVVSGVSEVDKATSEHKGFIERKGAGMAHYFNKQGFTPEQVQKMDLLEYEKHLKPAYAHAEVNKLPRGARYNSPGASKFAAEKEATVKALKELQSSKKK